MSAIVCTVTKIEPHPEAERLELLHVEWPTTDVVPINFERLVVGPHYRVGQLGVYIVAGQQIPNWLAKDLWLIGKANTEPLIPVVEKNMRGVISPGLFCGGVFQNDRDSPWQLWQYWNPTWKIGQDVSTDLGVVGL